MNVEVNNFPGIDLYDFEMGLAVQVTSSSSASEIRRKFNQAMSQVIDGNYPQKVNFILLKERKKYSSLRDLEKKIVILDLDDLYKKINDLNAEDLEKVYKFFRYNFELESLSSSSYYSNDAAIFRKKIKKIPDKLIKNLNVLSFLAFIGVGVCFVICYIDNFEYYHSVQMDVWQQVLLIVILLFMFIQPLYWEFKRDRFSRIWKWNLESDHKGSIYIVKISGKCYRCKFSDNETLFLQRIKAGMKKSKLFAV